MSSYNEKFTSIYPLIIDLINNFELVPFYDDDDTYTEFFKSIYSIANNKEIDFNSYRMLINSLLDFHQTSHIIIQKNNQEKDNYNWKNKEKKLNVYVSYLEAISNISRYAILISDENKNFYNVNYFLEDLSPENEKRINSLKNSINLDKIVLYIIHQIEYENDNSDEFITCVKNWINNYLKNNIIIKNLSKENIINIVSYFKYLSLYYRSNVVDHDIWTGRNGDGDYDVIDLDKKETLIEHVNIQNVSTNYFSVKNDDGKIEYYTYAGEKFYTSEQ
jgi:hypothetical protein